MLLQEILSVIVVLLLSGNNLAVCVGPAVGSGVIRERDALVIACIMFSLGLILGGFRFEYFSKLGLDIPIIALCSALLVLFLGEVLKIPMSLVYVTTTTTLTLASLTGSSSALLRLATCIGYWIMVVPISVILTLIVSSLLARGLSLKLSVHGYRLVRLLVVVLTVILCLSFGENNLGFLWALGGASLSLVPIHLLSIVLGVITLGRGVLRRIIVTYALSPSGALVVTGVSSLITYIATELGIPVSFSVILICSLLGLSYAYRVRMINYKYIKHALIWTYITVPLTAFLSILVEELLKFL